MACETRSFWPQLVLASFVTLGIFAAAISTSAGAGCGSNAAPYVVGGLSLCVPGDRSGYAIRSASSSLLRFEEQYFVDGSHAETVDKRTLATPDGAKATAVLTSLTSQAPIGLVVTLVQDAVLKQKDDFSDGQPISVEVDHYYTGRIKIEFRRAAENRFEGQTTSVERNAPPAEHWIANFRDGSVDYVIGCHLSLPDTRPQFACNGGFGIGQIDAIVSLFGHDLSEIAAAFEANRSIVRSFASM